jgi:hypothetical protein
MSSMMPIFLAICFIAATVSVTAWPPSAAFLVPSADMVSATLAFSVFCLIDAEICSMEADVSSTLAACSLDACDSDCAVADTWPVAAPSASDVALTSPMVCASLATVSLTALQSCCS